MQVPKRIVKPFASALKSTYNRVIRIREQIEHQLVIISRKEVLVREWTENLLGKAASLYPGHDVSSYPVQTRMQRDFDSLECYRSELKGNLSRYLTGMQEIERTINYIIDETRSGLHAGQTVPWPTKPKEFIDDPWPIHWPSRLSPLESEVKDKVAYSFNMNYSLPSRRQPLPTEFTLVIAEEEVKLHARYEEGIKPFTSALGKYLKGNLYFREVAITEAMRCGIYWPELDEHYYDWEAPFFQDDNLSRWEAFARREELADILAAVSPETGSWYLDHRASMLTLPIGLDSQIFEELIAADLVQWGLSMPPMEMLRHLPFSNVRSLFTLGALSSPNGFDAAVEKYNALVISYGEEKLKRKINDYVDMSRVIVFKEFDGWNKKDSAAPRICANMLVKTLQLVYECDEGPLKKAKWNRVWSVNYYLGKERIRPTDFYQKN